MSESNIAKELGRDRRTINREVERGLVEHLNSDRRRSLIGNRPGTGRSIRWSAGKEQEAPPCSRSSSVRAGS
ncbi:hypothetical protein [Pontiella sulfatireligans]